MFPYRPSKLVWGPVRLLVKNIQLVEFMKNDNVC